MDILKQAAVIMEKRQLITANKEKYSISASSRLLEIPRSSYYYKVAEAVLEAELETKVKDVFLGNKAWFGAKKIKEALETQVIRRIMKRLNLVCVYQKASFKPHSKGKNEAPVPNHLNREFHDRKPLEGLVTGLTYVRVGIRWAYVCFNIYLYNW